MGEENRTYPNLVWKMEGNKHLGELGIDVRMILKWMLK
jgi:hypothetical protein